MDFTAENIAVPCYIGETRFRAGIFLSIQIAERKKYAEHLSLTKYESYLSAADAFFKKYGKYIEENFRLNKLYEVRRKEIYSVFSTPYHVGISESEYKEIINRDLLSKTEYGVTWQNNLTYEDAVNIVREEFVRIWHDPRLYIQSGIPLNTVIHLQDIMRRNQIPNKI